VRNLSLHQHRFRLTEQGKTIASRYSNLAAHRHLNKLSMLCCCSPQKKDGITASWRCPDGRCRLRPIYRQLVYETPGFIDFWQAATPLDGHLTALAHVTARTQRRK
jgi:phosphoenolpyruvate carboxylase